MCEQNEINNKCVINLKVNLFKTKLLNKQQDQIAKLN
jgi:hypothetical protein